MKLSIFFLCFREEIYSLLNMVFINKNMYKYAVIKIIYYKLFFGILFK